MKPYIYRLIEAKRQRHYEFHREQPGDPI